MNALRKQGAAQNGIRFLAAIALAATFLMVPPEPKPAEASVLGGAVAGGLIGGLIGGRGGMVGGAIIGGVAGGISKSAKRNRKYRKRMHRRSAHYRRRR